MTSLHELQCQWIEKFDEMEALDLGQKLAAPFLSVGDFSSNPTGIGPILLVGKATDKDWFREQFLSTAKEERVNERRTVTRNTLTYKYKQQTSAFWRFWKDLHEVGSPVIWTNLAKIGVARGNPGRKHLAVQAELAQTTLRAEIAEYRPSLIVIAGDYAKREIVFPIFGERSNWSEPDDFKFCWIERTPSYPAVLWIDHPEIKLKKTIQSWLEKAHELAQS